MCVCSAAQGFFFWWVIYTLQSCPEICSALAFMTRVSKKLRDSTFAQLQRIGWDRLQMQPPTVVCKMKGQLEYIHILHTCFCVFVFALICMLSRCLLTKISASKLSQKFIKSALLGGYYHHFHRTAC